MLLALKRTRKRLKNVGKLLGVRGWQTRGDSKSINELENKNSRERAPEIGDAVSLVSPGVYKPLCSWVTYVARRVIYVPPISGSAILA